MSKSATSRQLQSHSPLVQYCSAKYRRLVNKHCDRSFAAVCTLRGWNWPTRLAYPSIIWFDWWHPYSIHLYTGGLRVFILRLQYTLGLQLCTWHLHKMSNGGSASITLRVLTYPAPSWPCAVSHNPAQHWSRGTALRFPRSETRHKYHYSHYMGLFSITVQCRLPQPHVYMYHRK